MLTNSLFNQNLICNILRRYKKSENITKAEVQKMIQLSGVLVMILIAFFTGIAQTTGPLINFFLMVGMDYPAKVSIALANLFLVGGCTATIYKNAKRRNPKTGKTMVKLDLIMITYPIMSSGAIFGGIFKNFLSQILLTVLFILLFLFLIYDLCKVIRRPKQQQNAPVKQQQQAIYQMQKMDQQKKLTQTLLASNQKIEISKTYIDYQARSGSRNKVTRTVLECMCYFAFTILIVLLRGSTKFESWIGINPCGLKGWAIVFGHLLVSIIVCIVIVNRIIQDTQGLTVQQVKKYSVQITHKNVWYFLIAGFFAGFFAALLAIGGSLILVPVWLKFGVDKNYAGNSVPTLIFLACLTNFTIAYINHAVDHIPTTTLIFYYVFAFLCSAIGRDVIVYFTVKYKLEHFVIYLILFVVVCTLIAIVPFQINRLLKDYRQIVDLGYLC